MKVVTDKHTPGPWFVVDRGRPGEPMMSVMAERIAGHGPSHEVAICATGDSSQEMEDANARLIAKAPEMAARIEALERELWKAAKVFNEHGADFVAKEIERVLRGEQSPPLANPEHGK